MSAQPSPIQPLLRDKKLFCFGFGYTAAFLSLRLSAFGWKVAGTTTDPEKRDFLRRRGIDARVFDRTHGIPDPYHTFEGVTHVLLSVPPDSEGDPVFHVHGEDLLGIKSLEWVGYLSATSVYGDKGGAWIDETAPLAPTSMRGSRRLKAEQQWQSLYLGEGLPLHIFRIAGIYGPGRSAVDAVRSGTARRIEKPGHAFNRIHIDDIVQVLIASINKPKPGSIYNLADDLPTPSHEVIQFACNMAGIESPPLIPFDQAGSAPIVQSFYKENKRIRNDKIKNELGVELLHPDYRRGLQSCLEVDGSIADLLRFSEGDSQAE